MKHGQEKKTKSKKKLGKNSLPEIMVHMLKHSLQYLVAFKRLNKIKSKLSEGELNYFNDRLKQMNVESLETISVILSTYRIDDPIMIPTLKLFEYLDFKDTDSPDDDLMQGIFDALKILFDREEAEEFSSKREVYTAFSKLVHVPTLQPQISDIIETKIKHNRSIID